MDQKCPRKCTQKITLQLSQYKDIEGRLYYNLLSDLINYIVLSPDYIGFSKNWALAASFSKWPCQWVYMSRSQGNKAPSPSIPPPTFFLLLLFSSFLFNSPFCGSGKQKVSVLLSATVERFFAFHMRDFYQ